jgi:hypothetical protein
VSPARPQRHGLRHFLPITAAGVAAVYVIAAAATVSVSGHHVLPLFEGIGPPSPYQWVNPPPAFAASNVKPKAGTTDLTLTGPRQPQFASSPDGQCLLSVPAAAFSPHDGDTKITVTVTPVDVATLGPLPQGVAADGNAYRIDLAYQPSKTQLPSLAADGNVVLTAPHQANSMLYSADGRTWTNLPVQPFGDPTMIGATFHQPGWYIAGADPSKISGTTGPGAAGTAGTVGGRGTGAGTGLVAIGVVAAAVILGVVALAVARRRQRSVSPPAGPPARPSPPAKPGRAGPQNRSRGYRRPPPPDR